MKIKYKFFKITKERLIKVFIVFSILFLSVDTIYRFVNNINYFNKEKCFIYSLLPKWGFLLFEYFIELFLVITVGIFIAVLLERYFLKYKRFYPNNPLTAFLYASILPVCACTILPMIKVFERKIKFRSLITLIVAAPLLSPYIIMLSFSTLGIKYTLLRIISSFIVAVSSGFVVEYFYNKKNKLKIDTILCNPKKCLIKNNNIYIKTYEILKSIFPFLIIAAIMGITFEYISPYKFLLGYDLNFGFLGILISVLVGIPIYFCNGSEILFLRPFLVHIPKIPLGTAIAFSISSTAICITSFAILIKFIGKKLALILLLNIIITTILISYLINIFL